MISTEQSGAMHCQGAVQASVIVRFLTARSECGMEEEEEDEDEDARGEEWGARRGETGSHGVRFARVRLAERAGAGFRIGGRLASEGGDVCGGSGDLDMAGGCLVREGGGGLDDWLLFRTLWRYFCK